MKSLTTQLILAAAFGVASVSSFANNQADIAPEVLEQLPPVETVATPAPATEETAPPVTEEAAEDASAEQPEAAPADKPE